MSKPLFSNDGGYGGRFLLHADHVNLHGRTRHRNPDNVYVFCNVDHDAYRVDNVCNHDAHNGVYGAGNVCNHDDHNDAYSAGNVYTYDAHDGAYGNVCDSDVWACGDSSDGVLRNEVAYNHAHSLCIQQQYSTDNHGTQFCQRYCRWLGHLT